METWIWTRKGNFKRETEFLLIVAQNKPIKPIILKLKLILRNREASVANISESSKLAQKSLGTTGWKR